jgi:hypothetical protein
MNGTYRTLARPEGRRRHTRALGKVLGSAALGMILLPMLAARPTPSPGVARCLFTPRRSRSLNTPVTKAIILCRAFWAAPARKSATRRKAGNNPTSNRASAKSACERAFSFYPLQVQNRKLSGWAGFSVFVRYPRTSPTAAERSAQQTCIRVPFPGRIENRK